MDGAEVSQESECPSGRRFRDDTFVKAFSVDVGPQHNWPC